MINQITIEGCLTEDVKVVDSKTRVNICFVNFKIRCNKSYLKNGNWENKPYYFDVSYSTEKNNPVLLKLVKDSHVLITGFLAEERFNKKSTIKIKCTEVGILSDYKNIFTSQSMENKDKNYNNQNTNPDFRNF